MKNAVSAERAERPDDSIATLRSERARAPPHGPHAPFATTLGSTRKKPAVPPSAPQRHLDVVRQSEPRARLRHPVRRSPSSPATARSPASPTSPTSRSTWCATQLCIELKSLKLYFWSYRDVGAFHEAVTNTIVDDIVAATKPRFVRIVARWNVRGGIYTNVVVEHRKKGWSAGARGRAAARGESEPRPLIWAKVPGTAPAPRARGRPAPYNAIGRARGRSGRAGRRLRPQPPSSMTHPLQSTIDLAWEARASLAPATAPRSAPPSIR